LPKLDGTLEAKSRKRNTLCGTPEGVPLIRTIRDGDARFAVPCTAQFPKPPSPSTLPFRAYGPRNFMKIV